MEETAAGVFEPARELLIGDLETLRAIADPLRIEILQVTAEEPRTVKQIAGMVNIPPTKLYYHINALEERDLLRVVSTRLVSGILEKQYRAAAMSMRFDRTLLTSRTEGSNALDLMLATALGGAQREVQQAAAQGLINLADDAPPENKLLVAKTLSRLTPEQAAAFHARLRELLHEFGDLKAPTTDVQGYSLTILFHPLRLTPLDEEDAGRKPGSDPTAQTQ